MQASSFPPSTTMLPAVGRPRDPRIDDAVLQATADLLEEVGYLRLSVGAVAERAGTNKPAIYRRWPTKARLVHEAVFPVASRAEVVDPGGDLRSDIRALVTIGVEYLGRPAARAALPGLMAEMGNDPALQLEVLGRISAGTWGWLRQRLESAVRSGEVRADVEPSIVLELVTGASFVASGVRPSDELDADWVDSIVDIVFRGIAP